MVPSLFVLPSPFPDPWDDLLPIVPHSKPPGDPDMLRLLAYDIADPRRLARVANVCEDFGTRIQDSLFECWLDEAALRLLWSRLCAVIEPATDRIAVYTLDSAAARRRESAGDTMHFTERAAFWVV